MRDYWSHKVEKLKCICKTKWNNSSEDLPSLKRVSETFLSSFNYNSEGHEAKEGGICTINIIELMIRVLQFTILFKKVM